MIKVPDIYAPEYLPVGGDNGVHVPHGGLHAGVDCLLSGAQVAESSAVHTQN